ncbi:alpha/beta fold hydrolase [Pseudooceanicola sp. C21-150M6]|uniref:alpha/beta fold hydrolase n=1 Tax=Pseudooceanicola sp. C21-150M6 TaxID=3434355 RepID=UPI003D7FB1D9
MSFFETSDGMSLYYEDAGAGVPVLCLSGLTRTVRDFDFVAPHLRGVRMIRMDYRGRGDSDWGDPTSYTIPREALDAVELLNHLGVDKAALLGTSRGGLIALVLAATARDRLMGVAFNDIGPVVETGGLDVIMGYLGVHPPFATLRDMALARQDDPDFPGVPTTRWETFLSHNHTETAEGVRIGYDPKLRDAVAAGFGQPAPDLWPVFDMLADLPLAVLRGANSDLLSAETVAEMARRHPGLIQAVVPDRGHIPFLDEPEALHALTDWLEALKK